MVDSWSYNQISFDENETYSVGFNDGREFNKIRYICSRLLNGKTMLCFETEDSHDLTLNPSYISFYIKDTNT